MSYEPTLVIKKSDLEKHKAELENWWNEKEGSIKSKVYNYLLDILDNSRFNPRIDGIELIICQPELTSFNKEVRKVLYDWDVEFGTSN